MQNAKDTFYVTLQSRLAALNPTRTVVVRGVVRPAVVVDENELATESVPVDAFRLAWAGMKVDAAGPLPLVAMDCAMRYATDGSAANGGMDRGRLLAAMDAELLSALTMQPQAVPKMNYAAAGEPVALGTDLFWGDPEFGAVEIVDERLERAATVTVFAYQEAGEL